MQQAPRIESPPAAYAKYINDFEESDEVQLSSSHSATLDVNYSKKRNQYNECGLHGAMPMSSSSLQYPSTEPSSYSQYIVDSQPPVPLLSLNLPTTSKPKSIYDLSQRKRNMPTDKTCFAFLKFGDCHYGASCKFSHEPALVHTNQPSIGAPSTAGNKSVYSDIENSDATCRNLEKRLQEIQKELTMLEEESKKPKSSVVVPQRCQSLFPNADDPTMKKPRAAFNVGTDFQVLVADSRNTHSFPLADSHYTDECNEGWNRHRSETTRCSNESRHNVYDRGKRHRRQVAVVRRLERERGADPWSQSKRCKHTERYSSDKGTQQVSSSESSSSEHSLRFDNVSSGDEQLHEEGASCSRYKRVSNASRDDGVKMISDESMSSPEPEPNTVQPTEHDAHLVNADDISDEEDAVEAVDVASVIHSEQLVDVSDDELAEQSPSAGCIQETSSLRAQCMLPFVLNDCPVVSEQLPRSLVDQLANQTTRDRMPKLSAARQPCNDLTLQQWFVESCAPEEDSLVERSFSGAERARSFWEPASER